MKWFVASFIVFVLGCQESSREVPSEKEILAGYLRSSIVQDVDIYMTAESQRAKKMVAYGVLMKLDAIDLLKPVERWHTYTLGAFCYLDLNFDDVASRVDNDLAIRARDALDDVMPSVYEIADERKIVINNEAYFDNEIMRFCYSS